MTVRTSSVSATRTITAGRASTPPSMTVLAASYSASSGPITAPVTLRRTESRSSCTSSDVWGVIDFLLSSFGVRGYRAIP